MALEEVTITLSKFSFGLGDESLSLLTYDHKVYCTKKSKMHKLFGQSPIEALWRINVAVRSIIEINWTSCNCITYEVTM